jgi:hypothetical protein
MRRLTERRNRVSHEATFIEHLYDRFNARDIEAALSMFYPNVVLANALKGGHFMGAKASEATGLGSGRRSTPTSSLWAEPPKFGRDAGLALRAVLASVRLRLGPSRLGQIGIA